MACSCAWIPTDAHLPASGEDVLIWCSGRYVVAVLVVGEDERGPWRDFMDSSSDSMLEWPSHWMPLPQPPESLNAI